MKHVVVTGSHGVGKSTLAQNLVTVLQPERTVTLVRETARQLVERGFEVNDKMNEEGFVSYITLYLQSFRASKADLVISDRSLFDLLSLHSQSRRAYPASLHRDVARISLCGGGAS